jgi:hypothetical protein
MRKAMHNLLTTDPTLGSLLPADKWFQRGSVPDSPRTPFPWKRGKERRFGARD